MRRAAGFVVDRLTEAGLPVVELVETNGHPCIFAEWIVDPAKPTILIYGHYDVQPPVPLGKWTSPPFEQEIRDDRLCARGASDDKGSLLIPLVVVRAYHETSEAPPINLRFLIEGEEESGSPHSAATVRRMADRLACDLVVSADGTMWRANLPSITVASQGMLAMVPIVRGSRDGSAFRSSRRLSRRARAQRTCASWQSLTSSSWRHRGTVHARWRGTCSAKPTGAGGVALKARLWRDVSAV